MDFYLLHIHTNRLINISRLINLALESRDSNMNQIYNPKQQIRGLEL